MEVDVNVRERILKPVTEVFDAVVDHRKMSHYFISGASGPLEAGQDVMWEFADVGAQVAIQVRTVESNHRIVWESTALGPRIRTTMQFRADGDDATVVTVSEGTFPFTEEGVRMALGQNAGWTYMLCALKAYVQWGLNLRGGLNQRLTDMRHL